MGPERDAYRRSYPSSSSSSAALRYLQQQRVRPNDRIELDALDAIAVLVDRGIGVSLVPDRVLPWPGGLSIVRHRLPDPAPERVLGLLWPQASAHARLIQAVEREAILTLGGAEATNSAGP
ncbi:hypothetical protein I8E17_30255 (plasmid) [Rhizobium sp. AB2/73]|nr:LysR substrate-binding domain-containing protein [Rhizobium sp. AB2/73]QYA16846.1 hypothetical protein J5284_28925 [Rhizobium sp. AB2/73]UEQ85183.1 hypothetical protein I8E17_30255 [Rhizobium sp. AB2/73]